MYATIWYRERGTASTDQLALAGRTLAARLGVAPGFIACLQMAVEGGGWAVVCISEDYASLAEADDVVAGWATINLPTPTAIPSQRFTGEVIAQKGL
jgi:hypothetical protein